MPGLGLFSWTLVARVFFLIPSLHILHFLQHCCWADDANLTAKGKDPTEERRAWRDLDCGTEMLFIYSFRLHIFTEAVDCP